MALFPKNPRYLTLRHEVGHVISLPDRYEDPQACLMRSGLNMRYPCTNEVSFVRHHYGTQGGFLP